MAYSQPETYVKLSTKTASASTSIEFTSLINSTFTSYFLALRSIVATTDNATLRMTFSTNNGSTYLSSNYQYGARGYSGGSFNSSSASFLQITPPISSTTSYALSGNIHFYGLNQAVIVPQYFGDGVLEDSATGGCFQYLTSGMNSSTTGVNAIKLVMSTGTIASGIFILYGVKEP